MKCFIRNVLEVDEADDKVQLTTFKVGLKFREFVVALAKSPLKAMINMLLKAQKYIDAKDAQAAIRAGPSLRRVRQLPKAPKWKKRTG